MSAAIHSFCCQCGLDVKVDEDGCCVTCGATATGPALTEIQRAPTKRKRTKKADPVFAAVDAKANDKMSETNAALAELRASGDAEMSTNEAGEEMWGLTEAGKRRAEELMKQPAARLFLARVMSSEALRDAKADLDITAPRPLMTEVLARRERKARR